MTRISVIIPSYNRASLISATIENMLSQTLPPFEVIVVDDGSTDDSVEVIQQFGDRVKLIQQPNQGPGPARNAGFKASSGEYIQFMDSDDLASLNKLEVQYNALQSSGADFAYCPWVRSTVDRNKITFIDKVLQEIPLPTYKPMIEFFISGWSLVFQNCLFKRAILELAGQYRGDLMPSEDSEYFMRILLAGAVAVHTPECLVIYREHNINKITTSGTSREQRARDWTKYLTITGELVRNKLNYMSVSTRLALATNIENHLNYCKAHNLPLLPDLHPYYNVQVPLKPLSTKAYRFYQKLLRRVTNSPDYHVAFGKRSPGLKHRELVKNMGYQN
jgi:glycosyltransferase involved in cell wall biosynthesis